MILYRSFQIGEADARLEKLIIWRGRHCGRGQVLLRTPIGFAEGDAELVQDQLAVRPIFSAGALCTKLNSVSGRKKLAPGAEP